MPHLSLPAEFVVFDLEWTAWEGSMERKWTGPDEYREMYDIGAVLVTSENFDIKGKYRQLVRLELVSELPEYSVKLTGITQKETEENGVPFSDMVRAFKEFAGERQIYCWGTGDPDVLAENCKLKRVSNPFSQSQFRNMRDVFKEHGVPADSYFSSTIVEYFGERNKHTAHQGLDDALNIVEALKLLQAKVG